MSAAAVPGRASRAAHPSSFPKLSTSVSMLFSAMTRSTSRAPTTPAAPDLRDERFTYHYATEYRERGWSVIPLVGKRPALASWKEYQSRRATEAELREWFADAAANVGIVTGRISGLVVVDCDTPADGEFWLNTYPKSPLIVQTGGGGMHVYYQWPPAVTVRNHTKLYGRAIDLRAEGGYVVAPPSRHPTTGQLYAWTSVGDYSLDQVPAFDPAWVDRPRTTDQHSHAPIRNVRAWIRKVHAISGQGGHNATFKVACKLRDAGLPPEEALAELIDWNTSCARPPLELRQLVHKISSAYAEPRQS